MADRDKIPNSIRYRQTYKEICEGQDSGTVAQSTVKRIARHIKRNGQGGLALLKESENQLYPLVEDSLLRRVTDWDAEHESVDRRADLMVGDPDIIDSARRACHDILERLEDGQAIDSLRNELRAQMLVNEWEAFQESVPEHTQHHVDAQYDEIIDRIDCLSQIVVQEIRNYVSGQKLPEVDAFAGDLTKGLIV